LNKHNGESDSPIRRIGKDEKDSRPHMRREWPDRKQLASEQNIPLPKPGEKNKIQSVLIALPFIMLIIGLFVYFRGESAQNNGEPVLSELISREGEFKSVSKVSGIGTPKYYLWYTNGDKSRGARITFTQVGKLNTLSKGDKLKLELVPRVEGSPTLWAYSVVHSGKSITDLAAD